MIRCPRLTALASAVTLAGLVAPLAAEEPSTTAVAPDASICGGLGVGGEWVGGDPSSSDLASADVAFDSDGRVPAHGELVRAFFLAARTDVRAEVVGRPAGDPSLTIVGPGGVELASDDDGGGDLAARAETTLMPGAYCLVARTYDGAATDVVVRIGRLEHEPLTAGSGSGFACNAPDLAAISEAPLDAAAIAEGVAVTATVGQTPAWGFTLAEAMPLTVTAESAAGDPLVRLRDESGAVLAENDDADGTNSRVDVPEALAAGRYCLEMEDLNGDANAVRVTLAPFDAAADRLRRIGAAEFSPLVGDDVAVRDLGELGASAVVDVTASATASWLRFDVPEEGAVAIEAVGQGGERGVDPVIVLFDRVGRRIGENDDGPDGLDSLLVQRIRAGSYLIAVRLASGGTDAGNVRVLFERYVPAKPK